MMSNFLDESFANELSNDVVDFLSFVVINNESDYNDNNEETNVWSDVLNNDVIDNEDDEKQYKNDDM